MNVYVGVTLTVFSKEILKVLCEMNVYINFTYDY
jgi:hypothetical protein